MSSQLQYVVLLTGLLARPSLEYQVEQMQVPGIRMEVKILPINVAGLMTTELIREYADFIGPADRVIVPGLCMGDLDKTALDLGIPLERGPVNLKDLPVFFGLAPAPPSLDRYRVKIFAEIVDAPHLTVDQALDRARNLAEDGADVIDLGCLPNTPFPGLEEMVIALKSDGFRVSVDSMEPELLRRGGRAGADYLLSLKESTLWVADGVDATPVVIPETPEDMDSLCRSIDRLQARGRAFIADPILDPVHFGFTRSIVRFHTLRNQYPDMEMMMGTGNLSELTEADTGGINTLLMGMMSELRVSHLLTTQVSPHARRSVAELDLARRIMYRAEKDHALPKGYHSGLTSLHNRAPGYDPSTDIEALASEVCDDNFRIQVNAEGIHVFNGQGHLLTRSAKSVFSRFDGLKKDASHAFYMGGELARARIAWQLGKPYVQDQDLDWGVAVSRDRRRRAPHGSRFTPRGDLSPPRSG